MSERRPGLEELERPLETLAAEATERVQGGITCSGERAPKGGFGGWDGEAIVSPRDPTARGGGTTIGGTGDEGI